MQEKRRLTAGADALEKVRQAIAVMRRYKIVNRLCGGVRVFAAEDVFAALQNSGRLVRDPCGHWSLDGTPVAVVHGYPQGYYSAE